MFCFAFYVVPLEGWQPVDIFYSSSPLGFRREKDKYGALNIAEQLETTAKLSGHEKASTYDAVACTPRERLPFTKKQFKAYFVALLADKE